MTRKYTCEDLEHRIRILEAELDNTKRTVEALRESEAKYKKLSDKSPGVVYQFMMAPDGTYSFPYINESLRAVTGISPDEAMRDASVLVGKIHPEDIDRFHKGVLESANSLTPYQGVFRFFIDERQIWIEARSTPERMPDGSILWSGFFLDITERKLERDSLKRTQFAMDKAPDSILWVDDEGGIVYANETACTSMGYTRDELQTMKVFDIDPDVPPDQFDRHKEDLRRQGTMTFESRHRTKYGDIFPVEVSTKHFEYEDRWIACAFDRDITARKQAEETVQKLSRMQSLILNNSTVGISFVRNRIIEWVNPRMPELFGIPQEQFKGASTRILFLNDALYERLGAENYPLLAQGKKASLETVMRKGDGSTFWCRLEGRALDASRPHDGSIWIWEDITDRKRAEEELRESRRRLEDIIEFLPDATMVIDKEGRPMAWNRAMETMTGVKKEDMLGKGDYEYALPFYGERRPVLIDFALHPNLETEKQYTALQRAGDTVFGEAYTPTLPSGNVNLSGMASVLRDSRGQVVGAIECLRDNTERKRLEERLGRAEKMEVLGTLAGGVAHDLNNMLGLVVGYSELLAEKLTDNSALKKYADNIYQSSIRGAAIIQDLLTLTGRGVTVSEVIDLNRVVVDCLRTQEFEKLKFYQPGVKILTDFEDGLLNIQGSPIHLAKTIMNLVLNATEFISGQGEVTIRTENRYLDQSIQGYDDIREGDYVVLTVSDTGRGISANDLGRIFEPFYTRKVMGISATGLELAVVWGTVKDHNGYIDVQSGEGKGTTFTLYFPATREKPEKVEKTAPSDSYGSKGDSIPVVDDLKE